MRREDFSHEVPTVRTALDPMAVRDALITSWAVRFGSAPANSSIALLLAQIGHETGWAACDNFNIAGIKSGSDTTDDFCSFLTEEDYPAALAREVVATNPAASLKTTVPDARGDLIVLLPQNFRSFPSLTSGVAFYLGLLAERFAGAWPYVLTADIASFVHALKAENYFTAPPAEYLAGVYARFGTVVAQWLGFARVAAFQAANGLTADNICGPLTAAKMIELLDVQSLF